MLDGGMHFIERIAKHFVPPRATATNQATLVAQQTNQAAQVVQSVENGLLGKDAASLRSAVEMRHYNEFVKNEFLIHTPIGAP